MANTTVNNIENSEGTIFYRRRIGDWIRRYIIELVLIFLVVGCVITTTVITAGARRAFREAKDVRMALKFVGTSYYGANSCIYDPTKINGLADGAAKDIADVSTRKGEVYLYAWDEKENMPLMFEYKKGLYTVTYISDRYENKVGEGSNANQMMGHWDVTYSLRILNYDSE